MPVGGGREDLLLLLLLAKAPGSMPGMLCSPSLYVINQDVCHVFEGSRQRSCPTLTSGLKISPTPSRLWLPFVTFPHQLKAVTPFSPGTEECHQGVHGYGGD